MRSPDGGLGQRVYARLGLLAFAFKITGPEYDGVTVSKPCETEFRQSLTPAKNNRSEWKQHECKNSLTSYTKRKMWSWLLHSKLDSSVRDTWRERCRECTYGKIDKALGVICIIGFRSTSRVDNVPTILRCWDVK